MNRVASAVWNGSLREGKGAITTDSGVLSNTPYSFKTRFENEKGTNPEELIAAAHAGCFTMALSAQLATLQLTPGSSDVLTANMTNANRHSRFTATNKLVIPSAARNLLFLP